MAVCADKIKLPEEIKGVKLNEEQRKDLSEGKPLYLGGMRSRNGKEFNATVQINANRRSLEFRFDNTNVISNNSPKRQASVSRPDYWAQTSPNNSKKTSKNIRRYM